MEGTVASAIDHEDEDDLAEVRGKAAHGCESILALSNWPFRALKVSIIRCDNLAPKLSVRIIQLCC
jgi:hypothetical protein